ncbi:SDR family oxidoreductase [Lichenihabitans sp. PAMC28606]|uniref:SDR family NAD(P)-dependent oxidoreductase n=1 Tax=Lichenihabitans sp. PAMC28606 TaxID=2880932 RepID=UPI001D0ACD8F|nr:SDR family oxidoreductase [Lichenihabitans sp. PAMC28606]UDL93206.1 SDR family oxidoreductase [Lichenihabitans sp. PAMC28606]
MSAMSKPARSVLVTGGSRGLGLGIGRHLASEGYRVIAVARHDSEDFARIRAEATATGPGALLFEPCDLGDIDALPGLVQRIRQAVGPIYGLVNNAAIGTEGLLAIMHQSQIETLVRLNTLSPIVLTKYVARQMMSEQEGRIVNVSSIIASTGYSGLSVYGATKASMLGFTRSLAREVGRLGITVNAVAPGFMDTEMTAGMDDAQRQQVARRSALRRLPEIEDVARMVAFLMGEGGRNITGTVMTVDAGNTA